MRERRAQVLVRIHAHLAICGNGPQCQRPGGRPASPGEAVGEAGSPWEVSAICRAGAGRGIALGLGWLGEAPPCARRYELLCNLRPWLYAIGMHAELGVRRQIWQWPSRAGTAEPRRRACLPWPSASRIRAAATGDIIVIWRCKVWW